MSKLNFSDLVLNALIVANLMLFGSLVAYLISPLEATASSYSTPVYTIEDTYALDKKVQELIAANKTTDINESVELSKQAIVVNAVRNNKNMVNEQLVNEIVTHVDKKVNSLDDFNRKDIIFGIIEHETRWGNSLVSWDGSSYGSMQVNYNVWRKECNLNSKKELLDTHKSIDCGVDVFMIYLNKNNGDIEKALRGYRGSRNKATNTAYAKDIINRSKRYRDLN